MSLLALQRDMRLWLTREDGDAAARLGDDTAPGLRVYQNNYRAQLAACLGESFERTRDWIGGGNRDLAAFAATHPGVIVADWSQAIAPRTDLLAGDDIHPGEAGGRVYADTVTTAVDAVANQRAQVRYQVQLIRWATTRALAPTATP